MGGYSPRSGGMSGQHASKKNLAASSTEAPGPGTYSPTILRNGKGFGAGAGAPAWKLLGRSPAARFISKLHSDIDNAGRNGPGPAGYSPRQTTARGERELLFRITLGDEEEEYDDEDDEAAAGLEVETAVSLAPSSTKRSGRLQDGAAGANAAGAEAVEAAAAET